MTVKPTWPPYEGRILAFAFSPEDRAEVVADAIRHLGSTLPAVLMLRLSSTTLRDTTAHAVVESAAMREYGQAVAAGLPDVFAGVDAQVDGTGSIALTWRVRPEIDLPTTSPPSGGATP